MANTNTIGYTVEDELQECVCTIAKEIGIHPMNLYGQIAQTPEFRNLSNKLEEIIKAY